MLLYDTLSRRLVAFAPSGREVRLYVCGITPCDSTHPGHVFTYAAVHALVRLLEHRGYTVRHVYVQNLTDVDDAILREARRRAEDWRELGRRWTVRFILEMVSLNVRPPTRQVPATDVVPDTLEEIRRARRSRGLGVAAPSRALRTRHRGGALR